MAVSKAQQRATNKWMAANYDRVNLTLPKGQKEVVQSHAAAHGESVNGFIGRAISETMERDSGTVSQIAQNGPESTAGCPPMDALKAAQEAAGTVIQPTRVDKVKAAENLFRILGDLGTIDLDKARCERLGIVYLPPDTLEAAQQAAQAAGEGLPDFVARAVATQAKQDKTSLAMGINQATGGKLEKEA